MEIWIFVIGLIVGSALCVVLAKLSNNLDDIDNEYYEIEDEEETITKEKKVNSQKMTSEKMELTNKDIDTLITMICKKQLRMIKKNSYSYSSNKYEHLEFLKAKLNTLYTNE